MIPLVLYCVFMSVGAVLLGCLCYWLCEEGTPTPVSAMLVCVLWVFVILAVHGWITWFTRCVWRLP